MKTYLKNFNFFDSDKQSKFLDSGRARMTCHNNFYPFGVLQSSFKVIEFDPVTVLYGGNGSGKSTVLNIIAEKLGIIRSVKYNRSSFFNDYVSQCNYEMLETPETLKFLTSDDVFNNLFSLRERNRQIDEEREKVLSEREVYRGASSTSALMGNDDYIENYEKLRNIRQAKSNSVTPSMYVNSRVSQNLIGKSNGETALDYFVNQISQPGIYLLDEPENSLSASFALDLAAFLTESARFFGAQLIIATHSPFILSIKGAKIYNLDTSPVTVTRKWETLDSMKVFYDFFSSHSDRFENSKA